MRVDFAIILDMKAINRLALSAASGAVFGVGFITGDWLASRYLVPVLEEKLGPLGGEKKAKRAEAR